MTTSRLADAKETLCWAYQKIDHLERTTQAFFNSNPYTTVERVESDITAPINIGGRTVEIPLYKGEVRTIVLKLAKPLPKELRHLSRETLQSLRSPLDYAVCRLAEFRGLDPDDPRWVFPVARAPEFFNSQIGRLEKAGIGNDAANFIRSEKPYPGGNDSLVTLHELNAHEKHRRLTAIAAVGGFERIQIPRSNGPIAIQVPAFGSLDEGIPLLRILKPNVQYEHKLPAVAANITFGNIPHLRREKCGAVLRRLGEQVTQVLERFETRFF